VKNQNKTGQVFNEYVNCTYDSGSVALMYPDLDKSKLSEMKDVTFLLSSRNKDSTTSEFVRYCQSRIRDIVYTRNLFEESLKNNWKAYKYLQAYSGYLLGSFSDEEFQEIAEKFASPYFEKKHDDIVNSIGILFEALGDLDVTDIAQLLDVDPKDVEEAVTQGIEQGLLRQPCEIVDLREYSGEVLKLDYSNNNSSSN